MGGLGSPIKRPEDQEGQGTRRPRDPSEPSLGQTAKLLKQNKLGPDGWLCLNGFWPCLAALQRQSLALRHS